MVLRRGALIWLLLAAPPLARAEEADEPQANTAPDATAPAAAAPAAAPEKGLDTYEKAAVKENAELSPERQREGYGLFGPLRIGPTAQLGLPHPINYGLDALYDKTIGFGFSTGKYSATIKDTKLQLTNWDVRLRWHPWRGSFFLGLAYGQQELFAERSQDINFTANGVGFVVPTTVQVDIKTNYWTPHLGWFSVCDCGFTMGFEIGAQIPMKSSDELKVGFSNVSPSQEAAVKATSQYADAKKKVDDISKKIGKQVFPYITLLRLGWLL